MGDGRNKIVILSRDRGGQGIKKDLPCRQSFSFFDTSVYAKLLHAVQRVGFSWSGFEMFQSERKTAFIEAA